MTRGIVHGLLIVGGVLPVAGATRQAPPQAGLSAAALNATTMRSPANRPVILQLENEP